MRRVRAAWRDFLEWSESIERRDAVQRESPTMSLMIATTVDHRCEDCGTLGRMGKRDTGEVAMRRRVLIVDDSILMRRLVTQALVDDGWEVAGEASNGIDAAEKYRQSWPDAVTLDITMPECSGLKAVQAILDIDPKAKVVVVSALNQTKLIAEAIRAGAQGFVVKPFLPEHLQEALRATMEEPMKV
jgi:two-component system, chemotaxis family, chemotaxis protein CheY